jgi:ferric-dicitrate binding protein FerR (iron transport regulator)
MEQHEIKNLLVKYQAGKCTTEEAAFLEAWYAQWNQHIPLQLTTDELESELLIVRKNIFTPVKALKIMNWGRIGIAASLLTILCLGTYFALRKPISSSSNLNVYYSPLGQTKNVVLPDGSLVKLNVGSKLTLLPGFNKNKRDVRLEGEAYFSVKHNLALPFRVHTANLEVKDLGTVFNVKAYPTDRTSEAVLIKGAIEVIVKNNRKQKLQLTPNKKFVLFNSLASAKLKQTTDNKPYVANYKVDNVTNNIPNHSIIETDWTSNKLSFYEQPLEDIAPMLERWYNIKLIINNQQIEGYKFTATFNHQSISEVLDALKLTATFNYRREANVITIY